MDVTAQILDTWHSFLGIIYADWQRTFYVMYFILIIQIWPEKLSAIWLQDLNGPSQLLDNKNWFHSNSICGNATSYLLLFDFLRTRGVLFLLSKIVRNKICLEALRKGFSRTITATFCLFLIPHLNRVMTMTGKTNCRGD